MNQPWFNCNFYPTPAFQEYRPMFEKLSELSEEEDWMAFEEFYELEFMPMHIYLHEQPSGVIIKEYLLHIENGRAWFRY